MRRAWACLFATLVAVASSGAAGQGEVKTTTMLFVRPDPAGAGALGDDGQRRPDESVLGRGAARRQAVSHEGAMTRATRRTLGAVVLVLAAAGDGWADPLDDLAREFWTWRAVQQPLSHDDIPRIERPADWVPDWSSATVNRRRQELAAFDARWKAIDARAFPVPRQVDYRLMGSALARVRWELDILRGWRRNPVFYVAQTIGGIFEILLPPPPFDEVRSRQVLLRMRSIPATVAAARENLDEAERPFAELGIAQLKDVSGTLTAVTKAAAPLLAPTAARELPEATTRAIAALEGYRDWLQQRLAGMRAATPVGREQYVWFLSNVALVPYTPEALLAMGRQEWERAAAFETLREEP